MKWSLRSKVRHWLPLAAVVLVVGCGDSRLGSDPVAAGEGEAYLNVYVQLASLTVGEISVEVSAPGMETVYFNLDLDGGMASGTLTLRAGSSRTVTLRAFNVAGTETHRGSTTMDVLEGSNPAVSIVLAALGEGDPLEGIVGDYQLLPISTDWPYDSIWDGHLGPRDESTQLQTQVVDANGNPLDIPIHWAGTGVNSVGVASDPPWEPGASTTVVTATAIAGTQARQVRIVFQDWASIEPAMMLAGGGSRTCGINQDGAAFCWGSGVLGPSPVAPERRFTSVAVDYGHACAVAVDGSAWCWGNGSGGQLGDGNSSSSQIPVQVASSQIFTSVAVGSQDAHSCALTEGGAVWCWGRNGLGQLGDGTFSPSPVPVKVASDEVFRSLTSAFGHVCAVTANDDAYCWGNNFNGKAGDGSFENRGAPTRVAGQLKFSSVSAGTQLTCGLTTEADLYCWGTQTSWFPGSGVPLQVSVQQQFTAISVGGTDPGHHICGITGAQDLYCWGWNDSGQLGDGSTADALEPTPVAGGLSVRQITTGPMHTCAVTMDDRAYCWGNNRSGQLGTISRESSTIPARVGPDRP